MILKPKDREGRITLNDRQRREKREELFIAQCGMCLECHVHMTDVDGFMNSCTLDHIIPQPAGCKKRDNDDNLRAICWSCNSRKGSRRA